ncbi:MAG: radical SAM protein [Deltaproteobacteria bacterium]|nr:radical SAM protein [Deltaproteobacteria bacterium]
MIGFDDRPHLGCAMLIAACQEKGITTTLIKGQTRYLRDMFVNNSAEIWSLIQELKEDSVRNLSIVDYRDSLLINGITQFQDELNSLYHSIILNKNARNYFNADAIIKFSNLHNIFVNVYLHYLTRLNHTDLLIINHYVEEVIKSKPRFVGFSLQGTFDPFSRAIRKRIKELTGLPIIVGGAFTPFVDLNKIEKYFSEEYFDYLVVGPGEHALPSLIKALESNKYPESISNVIYKQNGKIRCNDIKNIRNLDILPFPDYTQFDLDLYLTPNRILPLQTARGCSWRKCSFCSHHKIYLDNYVSFSVERVLDIIQYLHDLHDCSHFVFNDEELPPGRARIIGEAILNNNIKNIYIYTYGRMTKGYNNNRLLSLLRNAGFVTIAWGMESGCQRILDLMNKGTDLNTMSQILKKSSKHKISNLCFIILGFPGETSKEAEQTIEFLKKHADCINEVMYDKFSLSPYSSVGINPEKFGVIIKENGNYSVKSGMCYKDIKAFYDKYLGMLDMNIINIRIDELKYILPGNNRRMLHFLTASHELIPIKTLLTMLKNRIVNSIFPIILGEIINNNKEIEFKPINIKETWFINKNISKENRILSDLEERLFKLSDGLLSIEEIIMIISNDYNDKYRKEIVQKKSLKFYLDIFTNNYGLGFAKSWRS